MSPITIEQVFSAVINGHPESKTVADLKDVLSTQDKYKLVDMLVKKEKRYVADNQSELIRPMWETAKLIGINRP